MKQAGLVCALCAVALIVGCRGRGETVVRITELPTIDTSGVDQYVTLDEPSIASGGLMVEIKGTAKQALGANTMPVTVTRFKDGERLDTKQTVIRQNRPVDPATMPVRDPNMPPEMEDHSPPPPPPPIEEGDPVVVTIDASCEGGIITKLVITGQPTGGGMR